MERKLCWAYVFESNFGNGLSVGGSEGLGVGPGGGGGGVEGEGGIWRSG